MELRIIKTDEQYRRALAEIEKLAVHDPDPESSDGARLELLAKLVEDYEKREYVFRKPDPIDAILFRMEQQGLRQKDLTDLLGGKNRVSEVLARKRPLTLPMIRALYEKLGISPELLIGEPQLDFGPIPDFDQVNIPVDLLKKRGWTGSESSMQDIVKRFLAPVGSPVFLKHTLTFGRSPRTDLTQIWLWLARIRELADSRTHIHGKFKRGDLNEEMIRYVTRLSWMDKGPRLAQEFLEERGIALVIEPHLPGTRLDGAALLGRSGAPVIGLTLREDRLDNFWFTLVHELVHAWCHLNVDSHRAIADENIEKPDADSGAIEKEANDRAAEILISRATWRRSQAYLSPSPRTIAAFAADQQISPAIVAGRLRYERQNFALFSKLVGYRQVRANFPEVHWD